ncbi:hypothetical protein A2767_05305 [Candidatus Roizmanbacteria bacterium RIFCSPHIGHO2_01_FULL_35_10]|uniref:LytR/CpsA/Psr regulator C-terminal domain-containing protein n=1 Tax=Candidatus Roizmanbacteria bacterium RIFCSPLOWO2_01_FULL_35_13 TaxID=1802055 RepID=A0A1F7IBY6_9BACT|nr:MAG: hypothetical protein A2767_05305 [Candidatus Roizmanbacteria bacterium RIFCSPHIGHO2_01_FULL_35_10]OGK40867.1 MAG: hypothetical protein A3A74_05990 [Candidatus Roizmanbacteria bacterium RIFCSPLOWO2_01_FULL_35_13]
MKTHDSKKKIDNQDSSHDENNKIKEPPKNLLPEHTESQVKIDEIVPASEGIPVQPVIQSVAASIPVSLPPQPPSPPVAVTASQVNIPPFQEHNSKRKILWIGLAGFILALVLAGGWFYFSNISKKAAKKSEIVILVTPTASPISPTKTASDEVKLDKYPIQVLNGSGVAGEASKMQKILEEEGFEVSDTGNADKFDYTDTVIQAKKGVEKSFLDKLKVLLSKTYSVGKDKVLDASDSSEVIVIVGSDEIK